MEIETAMNLIWTPAQLAMFAKVVDLNGFSAAARALAVLKAAVSRPGPSPTFGDWTT